jgi:hypothetical protein
VVPVLFRRFGRAAAPTVGSVGGEA